MRRPARAGKVRQASPFRYALSKATKSRQALLSPLAFAPSAVKAESDNGVEMGSIDGRLDQGNSTRQWVGRELRKAIETQALTTWFQPIVSLDTAAVVAFEALLRWHHPLRGQIAPPEIIIAARENGIAELLTEAILTSCCTFIRALLKANCHNVSVAMNVSPLEFETLRFDQMVLKNLHDFCIPASMFEMEITEECLLNYSKTDHKLSILANSGISIALDDFGTGFSNLDSLKYTGLSKIKIDQSFIRELSRSETDQLIVRTIIDVGGALGIEVTAEGVETQANRRTLHALGCGTAQGFLFSRALPLRQAVDVAVERSLTQSAHV